MTTIQTCASDRFDRLIRGTGFQERRATIEHCLSLVCQESLRTLQPSSLNADGVPMQIHVSLSPVRKPGLGFVAEAYTDGMEYLDRLDFGCERLCELSEVAGLRDITQPALRQLMCLVEAARAGDGEDPHGAIWIGALFQQDCDELELSAYMNVRRGDHEGRWRRLADFTGEPETWADVFEAARVAALKPLGAGLRISRNRCQQIRLYFGAYGVKPVQYCDLFRRIEGNSVFADLLNEFFKETIAEDHEYPTRSAVVSYGLSAETRSPKLELCAHCAWRSDKDTMERCTKWLKRIGANADLYGNAAAALSIGRPERAYPAAHAMVGVGLNGGTPYASFYFNPGRDL